MFSHTSQNSQAENVAWLGNSCHNVNMSDFIDSLRKEIKALEADIRNNPDVRVAKLHGLLDLAKYYGLTAAVPPETGNAPAFEVKYADGKIKVRRRSSPERQRALELAEEFLGQATAPVKTSEIWNYIIKAGIVIPGENPQNNLSAMLSNSDRFRAHGRAGWTIAGNGNSAPPVTAGSPEMKTGAQGPG